MPFTPTSAPYANPYQSPPQFQPPMPQMGGGMPQQALPVNNRAFIFTGNAAQGGTVQMPGSSYAVPQTMWDTMNPTAIANRPPPQPYIAASPMPQWGGTPDTPRTAGPGGTLYSPTDQPQQITPPQTGDAGVAGQPLDGMRPYYPEISNVAAQYGLDPEMFYRQLAQESGNFDPDVISGKRVSSAGAQGIAQFMPATAAGFGIDPYNVQQALDAAGKYMSNNLKMFNGDYRAALAAYNAGEGTVDALKKKYGAHWESYLPDETKQYLEIIHKPQTMAPWAGQQAIPQTSGQQQSQSPAQPQAAMYNSKNSQMGRNAPQDAATPQMTMQAGPGGRTVQQIIQAPGYASMEERIWFLQQMGASLSPNGVPMRQGMPAMQPPQGAR